MLLWRKSKTRSSAKTWPCKQSMLTRTGTLGGTRRGYMKFDSIYRRMKMQAKQSSSACILYSQLLLLHSGTQGKSVLSLQFFILEQLLLVTCPREHAMKTHSIWPFQGQRMFVQKARLLTFSTQSPSDSRTWSRWYAPMRKQASFFVMISSFSSPNAFLHRFANYLIKEENNLHLATLDIYSRQRRLGRGSGKARKGVRPLHMPAASNVGELDDGAMLDARNIAN